MRQRIRLTEQKLHRIIRESVKRVLNEMSSELAAAYVQGRRAQGQYDKAEAGAQYARDLWNKQYGYNDNGDGYSYQMEPWKGIGVPEDEYATNYYYPGSDGYKNNQHYFPSRDMNHTTVYAYGRRFGDQTHGLGRNGDPDDGDSVAYRMNNITWEDVQNYLKNHPDKQEFLKTIQQRKPASVRNRGDNYYKVL